MSDQNLFFDPDSFLSSVVEGSNDTKLIPVPVGEYPAILKKVKPRQWQSKNDPTLSGVALDVTWEIEDPAVKETLGREVVTVRQSIMLDVTESGQLSLAKGSNVQLGRLREAVRLNRPGEPFAIAMLLGQMAKVRVTQRIVNGEPMSEVSGVAAL